MSATAIATAAGLVTALGWGTSDYLSARSTKSLSPAQVNVTVEVLSLTTAIVLLLAFGVHLHTLSQFLHIMASSICVNAGYLLFLRALSGGAVGVVAPLGNMYPFVTVLLTVIFMNVHFGANELLGMLAILSGAVILAYEKNHEKLPLRQLHEKTIWACASAVVWGVGFFILNPVVSQVPWQTISITSELFSLTFAIIILIIASGGQAIAKAKEALTTKVAYVTGVAGMVGMVAFYVGSTKAGSVVIPTVLSACGPLVASGWGRVLDHEKIGWLKRVGAVAVVTGIVVLNLN